MKILVWYFKMRNIFSRGSASFPRKLCDRGLWYVHSIFSLNSENLHRGRRNVYQILTIIYFILVFLYQYPTSANQRSDPPNRFRRNTCSVVCSLPLAPSSLPPAVAEEAAMPRSVCHRFPPQLRDCCPVWAISWSIWRGPIVVPTASRSDWVRSCMTPPMWSSVPARLVPRHRAAVLVPLDVSRCRLVAPSPSISGGSNPWLPGTNGSRRVSRSSSIVLTTSGSVINSPFPSVRRRSMTTIARSLSRTTSRSCWFADPLTRLLHHDGKWAHKRCPYGGVFAFY